ncbi:hypothetical protein WMF31_24600 [Sorangium sp. So ce1036]|uniref:hypothetical protein n=1 Tax=Sorangium sp. So ce1036 TaxID=3133328 RepID=UPI003F046376
MLTAFPDPVSAIQILMHGGTRDHASWDWPYQPEAYSHVEHATRRGVATLHVDRLGHGGAPRRRAALRRGPAR